MIRRRSAQEKRDWKEPLEVSRGDLERNCSPSPPKNDAFTPGYSSKFHLQVAKGCQVTLRPVFLFAYSSFPFALCVDQAVPCQPDRSEMTCEFQRDLTVSFLDIEERLSV